LPAVVDHDERRAEIVMIAANVIGRGGLKAATIRNVAAAAGCSTKVITHYFADKSELLFRVYYDAAMRSQHRFDTSFARDPCDLQAALEAFLPLDQDIVRDWKIFIASWDMAFSEGIFLDRQRFWLKNARQLIQQVLEARRIAGCSVHADVKEAQRLLMLVMGIASQAVFGERIWSASNQRRILAEELLRA